MRKKNETMKGRITSLCLSAVMLFGFTPIVKAAQNIEIHVSPQGTASGSGAVTDPVDGLNAARQLVLRKKDENKEINVIFHEGTYRFSETVKFGTNDSGTASAPISYKAASGEKVYFKGSKEIDSKDFVPVEDSEVLSALPDTVRGKVLYADLSGFGEPSKIPVTRSMYYKDSRAEASELYVNNKHQTLARWPNGREGYSRFETVVSEGGTQDGNPDSTSTGGSFTISENRISNWINADNAYIVGFLGYDWSYDRTKISQINAKTKTINLERGTSYKIRKDGSRRWAIINLLEELDTPGEYYIDYDKKLLYYYPETEATDFSAELTMLDNMIEIDGTDYISFEGITFSSVRGTAIFSQTAEVIDNLKIDNCCFENIGRYGIWHAPTASAEFMRGNSQQSQFRDKGMENSSVTNNTFRNIGLSAISMYCGSRQTNTDSNCRVSNNYISYMGEADRKGNAMEVYGVGVEITNNTVHDTGYGICFVGSKIKVANNEIYNVMKHLNDGAAIYTGRNFVNRGNKVYNNYIHDVTAKDNLITTSNSHGIYLDDMDSGTEVYGNIIVGVDNGVLINCGMSNNVHDNVIVDASQQAVAISSYNQGNAESKKRIEDQVEKALKNENYSEFFEEIKADINSGKITYPAGNISKNNIMLESELQYTDYVKENNTVENNQTAKASDFVNAEAGDWRLTTEAKERLKTTAPSAESFDYNKIGANFSKFTVNPVEDNEFLAVYPRNEQKIAKGGEITFTWQGSDNLDSYHIIIAQDSSFSVVVDEQELYERVYTTDRITEEGKYFWRVSGKNEGLSGGEYESDTYSFVIGKGAEIVEEDVYEMFDLSDSVNAKAFEAANYTDPQSKAWKNTKLDVESCLKKGRENYPSKDKPEKMVFVLNKTAFDKVKNADGNIVADNGIPFKITTDKEKNAIKLGGGVNPVKSVTVDAPDGRYEELYFPNLGVNGEYISNFKVTAHYTDGTEKEISTDCNQLFSYTGNKESEKYNKSGSSANGKYKWQPVTTWISSIADNYNASNCADTALIFRTTINDVEATSPVPALNMKYYIPVYSMKTDPNKILDKVVFSGADSYTNVLLLGITGKKTAEQILSEYESKDELSEAETDRAYSLLISESKEGKAELSAYPNILAAKAKNGNAEITLANISQNKLMFKFNVCKSGGDNAIALAAVYESGKLVEVVSDNVTIGALGSNCEVSLEFRENIGARTVKCFIWESINSQKNLARVYEIEGI